MENDKLAYAKISYDGSYLICEAKDVSDSLIGFEEDDLKRVSIETVYMTLEEFESLPEFDGW